MTQSEIQHFFQHRYNQKNWKQFLGETFANVRLLASPDVLTDINTDVATSAFKLGYIILNENGIERQIAVYEVVLGEGVILERNRVGLRNLLRKYWKNIDAAFIVYHNPVNPNWRFTYVSELTGFDVEGELVSMKTEPKRYTYILGEGETCRTAAERFSILLNKSSKATLDDVKDAFSVEKLSRSFFDEYKNQYEDFVEFLTGKRIVKIDGSWQEISVCKPSPQLAYIFNGDEKKARDFCKKLLGRIVFLYFIQKKGWLGVPMNGSWGDGDKNFIFNLFYKCPHKEIFYSEYLTRLFFDTLNTHRQDNFVELISGDKYLIPYLNGGLFEEENKKYRGIIFPSQLFQNLFTFFNQYNFTIYEDDPNDHTIAVDPEMLGHIFENLLEDNKDKGAYYTPKEIVHYMCQESLIEYLVVWFEKRGYEIAENTRLCKTEELNKSLANEEVEKQILSEHTSASSSRVVSRNLIEELIRKNLDEVSTVCVQKYINQFHDALDTVKICDPAIGSGAFPMGLLHEIFSVKQTLYFIKHGNNEGFNPSAVKLNIIQNSIYGVDIEKGAVDIARLRFWLSLIVDEPIPKALPNLDYKIMQGNSLLEYYEDLNLSVRYSQETNLFRDENKFSLADTVQLKKLVEEYFNIDNSIIKLDIQNRINEIVTKFINERINEKNKRNTDKLTDLQNKFSLLNLHNPNNNSKIIRREESIKKINAELVKVLKEADKLNEIKSEIRKMNETKSYPFFLWHLWFSDIFENGGGFDIVIGNPPYIGQKGNNDIFKPIKNSPLGIFHQRRMDYFYFFFHQAINLAKEKGIINFITTNYYITATYADKLRQDFKDRTSIKQLINFNELKIFGSALGQHNIITLLIKDKNRKNIKVIDTQKKGFADSSILYQILFNTDADTSYFLIPDQNIYEGNLNYIRMRNGNSESSEIDGILELIKKLGKPLSEICHITQGIVTGADKLSRSHISKYKIDGEIGEGIFVLSDKEVENLNLPESDKIHLKPWFKNSDVKKWITNETTDESLIYYTSKTEKPIGINFFAHFEKFKSILINRNTRSGTPLVTSNQYDLYVKDKQHISYVMVASAFKRGAYYCISYARDVEYFESPKIVVPQRSLTNTFGYNEVSWYASADVYYLIQKDTSVELKYILALLNSKLYYLWFYHKGKRKGDSLELYLIPLSETPVKVIDSTNQKIIAEIVDKIISRKSKNEDTNSLERQIDFIVYKIYGITYDEVKTIDSNLNLSREEYEAIEV